MAVLAPIPSASVSTATAVKPGFFLSIRRPNLKSSSIVATTNLWLFSRRLSRRGGALSFAASPFPSRAAQLLQNTEDTPPCPPQRVANVRFWDPGVRTQDDLPLAESLLSSI